jgi:hypothetical protein
VEINFNPEAKIRSRKGGFQKNISTYRNKKLRERKIIRWEFKLLEWTNYFLKTFKNLQ